MKGKDFFWDRGFVYLSFAIAFALMLLFMAAFHIPAGLTGILSVIFWGLLGVLETWEFFRKKKFYDDLTAGLDSLERKYLISEMVEVPSFYEGKIVCDVLQESNKAMCEHVAEYRRNMGDFKEFIEMWVHEMKLPVSSLLLMLHNYPGEISGKALEQLHRIDGYTDTVLYYARSENAEKDYLIKEVSLKRAAANVIVKNRETLLLHNVQLQTERLDMSVMTDGKWLEYILGQFLANSIKYLSLEREALIKISAEDFSDRTVLHFWDNGIGIPESDLPYLFEKSFTGENGRAHARSTGMGLYIVKNLCDRLGHKIDVRSEKDSFTEFMVIFAKNDFYKITSA